LKLVRSSDLSSVQKVRGARLVKWQRFSCYTLPPLTWNNMKTNRIWRVRSPLLVRGPYRFTNTVSVFIFNCCGY